MPNYTTQTILPLLYTTLLLLGSCGPKKVTPQSQLHDSVMSVHDEVMPKMRDIYRLKKQVKERIKVEQNAKSITELRVAATALQQADDAMMDWMASYDKPSEDAKGATEYLEREKVKIEKVRDEMLSAINNAQNLIDAQ